MGGKQPISCGIEEERFCEVFEKQIKVTVQVLEKQLAPYLIGYLSNPTPDQLAQTGPLNPQHHGRANTWPN